MKFLKHIVMKAMVALAAIVLVTACDKPQEEVNKLPDLVLNIDVENITTTTAKVRVTHTSDVDNTWYGFVTDDIATPLESIAQSAIVEFDAKQLHRSKQYVTILENLSPETNYRYVAFGLTAEGDIYGEVSCVEFSTLSEGGSSGPDMNGMTYNDAWTVVYAGSDTINDKQYDHVIRVISTDTNSYATTIVYAEAYDPTQMRDLAEAMLVDLKKYLDDYNNAYGTAYRFQDLLYTGHAADPYDLNPGRYRAIAVGFTPSGEVSGLYAVSDEFEVEESMATSNYLAWVGNWSIEGQNGTTSTIKLERGYANRSLYMTGWEGFDDLAVEVQYDAELDAIFFFSQLVAEDYDLGEEYGKANIYLFASDEDNYYYDIKDGEYYIAIGGILDDGVRAIVRYGVNVPEYPKFVQMFFMAEIDGKYYGLTPEEDIPSFIAGMYPVSSTMSCDTHRYGHSRLHPRMSVLER